MYDKTPYKRNVKNMNYVRGSNDINWFQSQNHVFTQSQEIFSEVVNGQTLSQYSQNSE